MPEMFEGRRALRRDYVGRDVLCKYCGTIFKVTQAPEPVSKGTAGAGGGNGPVGGKVNGGVTRDDAEIARFVCPKCSKRLKMRRDLLGNLVTCRHCDHVFPTEPAANASPENGASPAASARRRRKWRAGRIRPTRSSGRRPNSGPSGTGSPPS